MQSPWARSKLLGRTHLPAYVSTYHGQLEPGGLCCPEAFADFAVSCKAAGFTAFKIHGWHDVHARKEARNVIGVRKAVGPKFPLMLDPAC